MIISLRNIILPSKGCGMIGRNDKLNRITGLDPANLLFEEPGDRLTKEDAK